MNVRRRDGAAERRSVREGKVQLTLALRLGIAKLPGLRSCLAESSATPLDTPVKPAPASESRHGGGRPPKYDGPSRPITVTLPESTLEGLRQIDADRGKAIVRLTEDALRTLPPEEPLVEVVEMAANTGLILVRPRPVLSNIPFLHLVKVSPTRCIIALDSGHDYKALELALGDALEVPEVDADDRNLLQELLEHVKKFRQSERVTMAEVMLIRMESKRRR